MKTLKTLLLIVTLLSMSVLSFGQANITTTTLSSAVSDSVVNQVVVSSATGFSASTAGTQTFILIDHELMQVRAISSTTLTVARGQGGKASPHASGARVLFGAGGQWNSRDGSTTGVFLGTSVPTGGCTATKSQTLPVVTAGVGAGTWVLYNCNNGTWVPQTLPDEVGATITRYCAPQFLGALTLFRTSGTAGEPFDVGTDTTPTAGRWQYGTVEIPKTTLITGLSFLNGSVAATDTIVGALYRADGALLANTATAGTTATGQGTFQDINLTATFLATGPARYWVAYQASGTTTRVRTVNLTPGATTAGLGAFIGMLGSFAAGTTGTVPSNLASFATSSVTAVTALPTSLISAASPVFCVF